MPFSRFQINIIKITMMRIHIYLQMEFINQYLYSKQICMFKTQSSSQDEEGFFRPTQKIVQIKNKDHFLQDIDMKGEGLNDHINQIVSNSRPTDYKARIMKKFVKFVQYPSCLDFNECQLQRQRLKKIQVLKNQEKPKKFYSLQEKYKNSQNFKQVYCKLSDKHQFDSYIFSLQKTTDYNQRQFISSTIDQSIPNTDNLQKDIEFDSNFQSGNLFYAYEKLPRQAIPEYDLLIQNDTNTKGYNQWFYFSVSNFKHQKIKINIVNFTKKHLMFEDGVRPVGFSVKDKKWKFIGQCVKYKKSYVHRYVQVKETSLSKNYYTLSFLLDCPFPNDKIFIALNFPYTYKKMINFIDTLIKQTPKEIVIKKQNLCYSISNNIVPYLVISQNQQSKMFQSYYRINQKKKSNLNQFNENNQHLEINNQKRNIENLTKKRKKNIVILARQHPGETVGSYVLQGFLRELCLKTSQTSKRLFKNYNFYIVPMINVDGVIYGNFRTNLAGFDLNRQWIDPNRWLHPQIYFLKKLISSLNNIQFVLDFHGHSKKLNSFIYSCTNPPSTLPQVIQTPPKNLNIFRLYPYLFSKECELFALKDCTYTISQDKMRTARINTFKALNLHPYVFTLQTGFYGFTQGDQAYRYTINDFSKIGKGAFDSLKNLLLNHKLTRKCLKQIQDKQYLFDKWSFQNKQDFGSQSNPSQDELNPAQLQEKVMPSNIIHKTQEALQQKQQKQDIPKKQSIRQKIIKKMVNKIKEKSQTNLQIIIPQKKIVVVNEKQSPPKYKKKSKSGRNNRVSKIIDSIGGSIDKKNIKNEEVQHYIQIKQARVQKPNYQVAQFKDQKQQASFRSHKKQVIKNKKEQIKSASNLLGTGYFQKRNSFFQNIIFRQTSKPKIQGNLNNSSQMMVSPYAYPSTNLQSIMSKLGPLSNLRQRTRTISLQVQQQTQKKKQSIHKERLYIIKQNKIVKVVNSTNKEKPKSLYLNQTLQQQIINRTQALKNCQKAMRSLIDQEGISIDQMKNKNEIQKKLGKPTTLKPLVTNSRNSAKSRFVE